jgi:hypothetical protein
VLYCGRLSRRPLAGGEPKQALKGVLFAVLLGGASGCYTYSPAAPNPAPGTRLVLELNDRGRVALGDSIGPSGDEVEGTLTANSDSAYSLRVVRVGYLNGFSNTWNGEPLVVSRDLVGTAKERRLSRSRSWLTATGVSAAVLTFIATRGLLGFRSGSDEENGGGGNQQ